MDKEIELGNKLELMDLDQYKDVASQFSILGDANRLRIFTLLCHREECVKNISQMMDMSVSNTSASLKLLKSSGLIESRRDGRENYYKASDNKKTQVFHYSLEKMMNLVCPGQYNADMEFLSKNTSGLDKKQRDYMKKIHDDIVERLDESLTIDDLAKEYHISPSSLKYQFKQMYGKSLAAHIKDHKMDEGEKLLRESDLTIAEIARMVGYKSPSKFSSSFEKVYGLLPSEYRKLHHI